MDIVNVMTCGSVDDGKSTLLGRLIFETDNLLVDQSEYLNKLNKKYKKKNLDIDYSLLLDGLIDERQQGITIDIAFKYFSLKNKQFILIDSPGHKEFTQNVANAATFADVALILLDITKGITNQTKKHIDIINMFPNIKNIVFCINKMDKVNYSKTKFNKLKEELSEYNVKKDYRYDLIIPISAKNGENITKKSKKINFYKNKTIYEYLNTIDVSNSRKSSGGSIVKFISNSSGKRIYHTENIDVNYKKGDKLRNTTTNEITSVKKIYSTSQQINSISNNRNSSIELARDIYVNSGDVLIKDNKKFVISDSFKSTIFWTSKNKLLLNKYYIFKFRNKIISGFISKSDKKETKRNDISSVQIELHEKNYLKTINENYYFSQFICIDPDTNETVGFGNINQHIDKGKYVKFQNLQQTNSKIDNLKCLWFTGLPSSGKSTIAQHLGEKLGKNGLNYYIIDGDNIRSTLNKDLGFTQEERIENNRRIAHLAKIIFDAGLFPIVTTISPNNSSRLFAKSLFDKNSFKLIYVKASLNECIKRDPKGLYKDKTKYVKNITGVHQNYDIPKNPDIEINTEELSIKQSVNKLWKYLNVK